MKQGRPLAFETLDFVTADKLSGSDLDFILLYADFVGGGEKAPLGQTNFNGDMVNRRGIGSGQLFIIERCMCAFQTVFLSLIEQIVWLALSLVRAYVPSPYLFFSELPQANKNQRSFEAGESPDNHENCLAVA